MNYLKEWNEACVYANECLPPFIYELTRPPYDFLALLFFVIFLIYLWNERR